MHVMEAAAAASSSVQKSQRGGGGAGAVVAGDAVGVEHDGCADEYLCNASVII